MQALVLFAYIAVPVLEIATIVWVSSQIGGWWTVAALLGLSLLGAVVISRCGRRAMQSLRDAMTQPTGPDGSPRQPDQVLADAGLVFIGGVLLLVPGFLTGIVGALWVLPVTRPLTRRWVGWTTQRRAERYAEAMRKAGAGQSTGPGAGGSSGPVVQGDVLSSRDSRTTGLPAEDDQKPS